METIENVLRSIAKIINLIGIAILIYGFTKLLLRYLAVEFRDIRVTAIKKIQSIRCELGVYILLALDFLVASDIIHTITDLTREQLLELTVMIVLRITIGYFLGKEINEIQNATE